MWIWIAMWKHPGGVISICPYQSLMSMHYQFAVARGIKRTRTSTQVQVHDFGRPSPDKVREKINEEIEESKHKWGSTLPSRTIHFPITARNTGVQWSPCVSPRPRMEVDTGNNTHLASSLSPTNRDARPPLTSHSKNSLSRWGKWKITRLSPVDTFQFHLGADLILRAHIKPVYETKSSGKGKKKIEKERWEWRESGGASGKMCLREGERSCGPGGARPSPIMAWHLESEPVKCQTGYDRNGDRQIMTDPWPRSSERSQLTQPPASWCAFRSRKKVSEPVGNRGGKFARHQRGRIHGNSLSRPIRSD